jgi:hypothetical protein
MGDRRSVFAQTDELQYIQCFFSQLIPNSDDQLQIEESVMLSRSEASLVALE